MHPMVTGNERGLQDIADGSSADYAGTIGIEALHLAAPGHHALEHAVAENEGVHQRRAEMDEERGE